MPTEEEFKIEVHHPPIYWLGQSGRRKPRGRDHSEIIFSRKPDAGRIGELRDMMAVPCVYDRSSHILYISRKDTAQALAMLVQNGVIREAFAEHYIRAPHEKTDGYAEAMLEMQIALSQIESHGDAGRLTAPHPAAIMQELAKRIAPERQALLDEFHRIMDPDLVMPDAASDPVRHITGAASGNAYTSEDGRDKLVFQIFISPAAVQHGQAIAGAMAKKLNTIFPDAEIGVLSVNPAGIFMEMPDSELNRALLSDLLTALNRLGTVEAA